MGIINFKCLKCRRIWTNPTHKIKVVQFKKSDKHKTIENKGLCPDCGEIMEIITRMK
jgi:hypothetical protein